MTALLLHIGFFIILFCHNFCLRSHDLPFLSLTFCSWRFASFTSSSFSVMFCLVSRCRKGSSRLTLDRTVLMFALHLESTNIPLTHENEGTMIFKMSVNYAPFEATITHKPVFENTTLITYILDLCMFLYV